MKISELLNEEVTRDKAYQRIVNLIAKVFSLEYSTRINRSQSVNFDKITTFTTAVSNHVRTARVSTIHYNDGDIRYWIEDEKTHKTRAVAPNDPDSMLDMLDNIEKYGNVKRVELLDEALIETKDLQKVIAILNKYFDVYTEVKIAPARIYYSVYQVIVKNKEHDYIGRIWSTGKQGIYYYIVGEPEEIWDVKSPTVDVTNVDSISNMVDYFEKHGNLKINEEVEYDKLKNPKALDEQLISEAVKLRDNDPIRNRLRNILGKVFGMTKVGN